MWHILTRGRVTPAVSVNLHISALSRNVWSKPLGVFSLNNARRTLLHPLISLRWNTHKNKNKTALLEAPWDLLRLVSQLSLDSFIAVIYIVGTREPNKPELNLAVPLPRRVGPKWSVLVSAVMNAPLPRGAACTRARCVTMVTCGTAQAASSVPATGVRSCARGPSVVVLNAHRWVWKGGKNGFHYKIRSKSGVLFGNCCCHFCCHKRFLTGLKGWIRLLLSWPEEATGESRCSIQVKSFHCAVEKTFCFPIRASTHSW